MEAVEDSNCHSNSDSFSVYERYLRTFNVVDTFLGVNSSPAAHDQIPKDVAEPPNTGNVDLCLRKVISIHSEASITAFSSLNTANLGANSAEKISISSKLPFPELLDGGSLLSSSITEESNLTDKSDPVDPPASSEDSKSDHSKHPKPVIITSLITMENSNNAVDSVPMFRDVRHNESVFKLPTTELSFNGTLKHVQKLKPIVDPLSALTSSMGSEIDKFELPTETPEPVMSDNSNNSAFIEQKSESIYKMSDYEEKSEVSRSDATESTGDSQYEEYPRKEVEGDNKWGLEQSYSSLEASFDSGVRSPDMFSDDEEVAPEEVDFWDFLKDFEAHDKHKIKKMEATLSGVLPPPSVTIVKTDVTEMLKKYYCFLPAFSDQPVSPEVISTTPTKRTSYVKIPDAQLPDNIMQTTDSMSSIKIETKVDTETPIPSASSLESSTIEKPDYSCSNQSVISEKPSSSFGIVDMKPKISALIERSVSRSSISKESSHNDSELNTSACDKSVVLKMCTENEAKETPWPDLLKCRFHDVYYNVTKYSERLELLALRCGERFVGGETDTSVTVFSGGLQSPSSANKRKAMRLKMAQAKSPGRRLSHLARRRQAFCSAATIGEKAHTSTSKMVLIDKNFFPHRKLINSADRKSPRLRRTPGKRTPGRKTPGKKTPAKTPKTRSGGSSRKKAMRRLLLDPETLTRSQPTRETSKRALFISPENRKPMPQAPSTSVPLQAMKSKRNLFGSPVRPAETKSLDGSESDMFLKRKRDSVDGPVDYESRSKIAKSLSFGGDTIGSLKAGQSFSRRASEMFAARSNMAELDEHHRKKLLWAVSEALRVHGWRMQSPGFREKASLLARLTRRLLALPPHRARLAAPAHSTSETMLKIARMYVFAIIQGRSVDECFQEEQTRLANESNQKVSGYISASAYQQIKNKTATSTLSQSQIKENTCDGIKHDQPRSGSKNILQDKLLNVDSNSNSSSGLSMLDKTGLYKSNSMPSFEEAAKMRARRQISFDNVDFPKR
ncbi:uncharacterized protein LOC105382828 [Plutella xylostella]|uniref:uncharacterized protein LOC105382828 n=1 Tax=Plutella xylostella TaxID=51655 RepID=UPI002032841D|nr:uncharacterized protein LOC105382828 [Plutella xylostella]